ncbi:MAG: dipeptidase [Planctomycetota bacterium]
MHDPIAHLNADKSARQERLMELLRIASVSADSRHAGDVKLAAEWVAERFRSMGLVPEVVPTAGNPIVYAESPPVPGAPVALVYGHYDVQPPEPLELWTTPPFEPTLRDGNVYARGATDDKGQMLTHLEGAAAWLAGGNGAGDGLPLQVKFLIEGEEEVGSANLEPFVQENKDRLACDVVVISDSSQFSPGMPAITYGLRGITYYELRIRGPQRDLHSGSFGGAVTNPAVTLAKMLAAIMGDDGRVQLPGFYNDVKPLTDGERAEFASLPFEDAVFAESLGVDGLTGEAGYTTLERRWARPSFDVCGLWSGYQGEGAKTVLPAEAGAKFSFRLVPDQDPEAVTASLESFLESLKPRGIEMQLIDHHGAPGVAFPPDGPFISAASRAIEEAFDAKPVKIREGGSIPIVNTFADQLGAEVLLLGWGLDDDNTHSPNEKFCLADFHRGAAASALLWRELASLGQG